MNPGVNPGIRSQIGRPSTQSRHRPLITSTTWFANAPRLLPVACSRTQHGPVRPTLEQGEQFRDDLTVSTGVGDGLLPTSNLPYWKELLRSGFLA